MVILVKIFKNISKYLVASTLGFFLLLTLHAGKSRNFAIHQPEQAEPITAVSAINTG